MEYKKNGKLFHHLMDVNIPETCASPSSRDKALETVSGELHSTHTKYLQEISAEQVRLFVRRLLDHHQSTKKAEDKGAVESGKFKKGARVEVYWAKEKQWYAGVIVCVQHKLQAACVYSLDYDDGDQETDVKEDRMRAARTRVTFASKIIAVVTTRPKTAPQDKDKLFYNGDDMDRFQMEAAQEAYAQQETAPTYAANDSDSSFPIETAESDAETDMLVS